MIDSKRLIPSAKNFSGQYAISPSGPHPLAQESVQAGRFFVSLFPGTEIVPAVSVGGSHVGWFVGCPVDYEKGSVGADSIVLNVKPAPLSEVEDSFLPVEHALQAISGKWVFLCTHGSSLRIYPDASASFPIMYEEGGRSAASCTGLLLDDADYLERFDSQLYGKLDVASNGWFPGGLTAHVGVRRLLANHYLDLSDMSSARFWPREDLAWCTDPYSAAEEVGRVVRLQVEAMCSRGSCSLALTAGNESRMLLASLCSMHSQLSFFTIVAPDAALDVSVACQLAKSHCLNHQILRLARASDTEQAVWQYANSHCVSGYNQFYHPTLRLLHDVDVVLGGLGGEIARAFFWRDGDTESTEISSASLLSRFGIVQDVTVARELDRWLDGVSFANSLTILDLAYLELRLGPWAFGQTCGQDLMALHFNPLVCSYLYGLMLGLPPDWKRDDRFMRLVVESEWPELLDVPINSYGDYRDYLRSIGRMFDLGRVVRGLRKRVGMRV